jgi:hypothetical protein
MCGILAALGLPSGGPQEADKQRREVLKQSRLLRHRGPDQNSCYQAPDGRAFITFERLMIVDPTDTGRRGADTSAGHCVTLHVSQFTLGLPRRLTCLLHAAARRQPFQIPTAEGNIAWAL